MPRSLPDQPVRLPVVRQGWEAAADHHSKRIEKREELLLLCLGQIEEALRHVLGLALVALDRALQGQGLRSCIKRGRMRRPQSAARSPMLGMIGGAVAAVTLIEAFSRSCH